MRASRSPRLLAVGLAAAFLVGATPSAAAADTVSVSIRPADEPTHFHLNVLPGQAAEREAVVTNHAATAVDLLIYPADATTGQDGGFVLAERNAPARHLGSWIRLPISRLHVAGRSRATVTFRVAVPDGTPPGDYAGGILIEAATAGQSSDTSRDFAFRVNLVQRLGVRAYLHVAGEAAPGLTAGRLTWRAEGDGLRFSVPVTNTGNIRLQPGGRLSLDGWNLPGGTVEPSRVEDLLPGATATVTGYVPDAPRYGWGTATARVEFGSGQHATAGTAVRLVPGLPTLGLLAAVVAVLLLGWRTVRFVRRARAALRELQRREAPATRRAPAERRRPSRVRAPRLGSGPLTVADITAVHRDTVTDLADRSLFVTETQFAVGACGGQRLCLMLVELNAFADNVDALGRAGADTLVAAVAERLRRSVRPQDLVARLEDATFAVLFEDVGQADVDRIARRMTRTVSEPVTIDGQRVRVRANLGVAPAEPADDADRLIARAADAVADARAATKTHYAWYAAAGHRS